MRLRAIFTAAAAAALLAACASNTPAPVTQRAPTALEAPVAAPVAASSEPNAGFYTVKKGDTLYGIALDHGQDYRDLSAWNSLDNPNLIRVGQQLRVTPPDGATPGTPVAVARPVTLTAVAPPRSLVGGENTDTLKRQPRAGKQAYSDQAWAQLQKGDSLPAAAPTLLASAAPTPVPAAQQAPAGAIEKPQPVAAPSSDETIEWAWPASGKLIGSFTEGSNKGIDLGAKSGQSVLAAASGKVTLVSNALRGYGNLVVVKHNQNFLSVYAHNSRILVKEGQSVARGEQIAEAGNTDTDQPKLHFEIRRQGKPVDPLQYLPKR